MARGGVANLVGALVLAASTFAMTVVVTRGLPRMDAGVFFSATSVFVLVISIGQLGTSTGLVYFLSRCRASRWQLGVTPYIRTALRPVLVSALLMGVGLFVLAPQVAALTTPGHEASTASYLRILSFFVPLAALESVLLAATRGLGSMRASVVVEQLGRPIAQLVLVAVVIVAAQGGLLPLAWSFAYLPAAIAAALWWWRAATRLPEPASATQPAAGREFWRFSGPRAVASVAQVAMQRLDIVLVGALAGVEQAAVYAAATRFLVIGQLGNRAISLSAQPRLGVALAEGQKEAANELYQVATGWLILLAWPAYWTLIVFGDLLLRVFGSGYDTATIVLVLLSSSMLVATGCGMVDMVLNMAGRTAWNLYNTVIALGVNLGLDLWLIPDLGILGAAIGWGCAIVVANGVALSQVSLVLRLHPLGKTSIAAAALTTLCFAGVPLGVRLLGPSWTTALVSVVLSTTLYAMGIWCLRRPLQLAALRDMRRRRREAAAVVAPSSTGDG